MHNIGSQYKKQVSLQLKTPEKMNWIIKLLIINTWHLL